MLMAILLQTLAARLGIVAGRDLAQACREAYPRRVCNALWVLCEIAIAACDLAEVLGAAIALNLLFRIAADRWRTAHRARYAAGAVAVSVRHPPDRSLHLWPDRHRDRLLPGRNWFLAKPAWHEMVGRSAAAPEQQQPVRRHRHAGRDRHAAQSVSAFRAGADAADRDARSQNERDACRFNLIDSVVALNGALIVNAAILVLAAAVFFKHGMLVTEIEQAQLLLAPLLGTALAGQSVRRRAAGAAANRPP